MSLQSSAFKSVMLLVVVSVLLLASTHIHAQQIIPNVTIIANPVGFPINACQTNLTLSVVIASVPTIQGGNILLSRNFTWLVNTTGVNNTGSVISKLAGTSVNSSVIIVNTQLLKTNTAYYFGVNITDRIQKNQTTITTVSQLAFLNNPISVNNGTAIGGAPALPVCNGKTQNSTPVSQSKKGQVSLASPSMTYGGVLYHITCFASTLLLVSVSLMIFDIFF
ncbi:hypothetical protein C9374_001020 [Naegleria lovaniensis]|uniref:Uncharacterized protein n=1 Tax=Naegleria lovaniensis TaxID=51637 RepID=A0AA88GWB3_NAELO|nr:uncharacterized protein C9374_001020 [Naegleria lovaniensis]KAG2388170.1 hypothetical protein C9374_001020 [Naegleria lovaniensis]